MPLLKYLTLRLQIVFSLVLASGTAALSCAADTPNIIYILADDLGYADVHCMAPSLNRIPTPNIDRLAAQGMIFTDAHSGSAVCTPTRYGVLTGRYAWRTKLQKLVTWGLSAALIQPGRSTVGGLLQDQGYETYGVGKWHLGMDWSGGPTDAVHVDDVKIDYSQPIENGPITHGFDSYFGISASLDMAPYVYIEDDRATAPATVRQTEWFRAGPAAADFHAVDVLGDLTDRTVAYIEERSNQTQADKKPFFIYLALTSPHTPIVPSNEWQGRSDLGEYGDFVMQTDGSVGEVMAALERSDLAENTLIIFTSDNGCSAGPAKAKELIAEGHHPSGELRGYKADLWEGGHRVPFVARWPGNIEAGTTSDRLICLTDLMATCAELTGVTLAGDAGEDSVSFLPTLLGKNQDSRSAVVHHSISGHFGIRDGNWKLMLARGSGGWTAPNEVAAAKAGLLPVQLYNLSDDLGETNNLANEHPEIVARLAGRLGQYVARGRSTPGPLGHNSVPVELWKSSSEAGIPAPDAALVR